MRSMIVVLVASLSAVACGGSVDPDSTGRSSASQAGAVAPQASSAPSSSSETTSGTASAPAPDAGEASDAADAAPEAASEAATDAGAAPQAAGDCPATLPENGSPCDSDEYCGYAGYGECLVIISCIGHAWVIPPCGGG